jgi:hypothetical protein
MRIILLASCALLPAQAPSPEALAPARLRPVVETLASPEFGGRGTGQSGFAKAAEYVAARMRELKLEPLGDSGTFLQAVPWTRVDGDPAACHLRARAGDQEVELKPGPDFAGRVWFEQKAAGELALWTCADPDAVDLDKSQVGGRILLVELPGIDLDAKFAGLEGARAWAKFKDRLRDANPAAVLFVDDTRTRRLSGLEGTDAPGKSAPAERASGRQPNEVYVSRAVRDRVRALAGADAAAGALQLPAVAVQLAIALHATAAPASNVVGRLIGSDAAKKDEHVVIGCHLDHLGISNGVLHPGADDDGSGIAAVLALAEAFSTKRPPPRRSMVFVAFCGEERGLLGSRHFVANPPIPLPSIVAELQLDMIGRSEENERETAAQNKNSLHLIGTEKMSKDLHALCLELNRNVGGFDLEWDEEDVFFRSDHLNFAKKGVPIAFFFTGFHHDYHAPGDTADKLDYDKLSRVATYVHAVASRLANDEARPLIDHALWHKNRDKLPGPPVPAAPVRK